MFREIACGDSECAAKAARIAHETGLAAGTVKNARVKLKDAGLVRATPDKDQFGEVKRWLVVRHDRRLKRRFRR